MLNNFAEKCYFKNLQFACVSCIETERQLCVQRGGFNWTELYTIYVRYIYFSGWTGDRFIRRNSVDLKFLQRIKGYQQRQRTIP